MMATGKVIICPLGGGRGYTLEDTDLWGLECALIHAQLDGYLEDNPEWATGMLEKLQSLRAYIRGETGEMPQR